MGQQQSQPREPDRAAAQPAEQGTEAGEPRAGEAGDDTVPAEVAALLEKYAAHLPPEALQAIQAFFNELTAQGMDLESLLAADGQALQALADKLGIELPAGLPGLLQQVADALEGRAQDGSTPLAALGTEDAAPDTAADPLQPGQETPGAGPGEARRAPDFAQLMNAADTRAGTSGAGGPSGSPGVSQTTLQAGPAHGLQPALLQGGRNEATAPPSQTMTLSAGKPGWAEEVGNRISLMIGRQGGKAELVLSPASLGKLEITLTVQGDQTSAQFVAATPAAREALEQAMPRLREILQQAGIQLADSQVSTSDQHQQAHAGQQDSGRNPARAGRGIDPEREGLPMDEPLMRIGDQWFRRGNGLVDIFA